jgi:ribosomal protein S18 acetylase RimI-like enzyme
MPPSARSGTTRGRPLEESYEEWAHWSVEREGFDPTLWYLARAGGEIAGFVLCRVSDTDSDCGWVSVLGVRRPWRRRGLGEALLRHSFHEFRARGLSRAALGVDASSPTGATRLYERAGMGVYRETVFYERRLERGRLTGCPACVRSARIAAPLPRLHSAQTTSATPAGGNSRPGWCGCLARGERAVTRWSRRPACRCRIPRPP